jgi:long-chain acyl-CoA synthetase
MLTHKNLLLSATGPVNKIPLDKFLVHISYLPLAHIFERAMEIGVFLYTGSIGFYSGDVLKLIDDVAELKPTIFCSVPRLFNKIYDNTLQMVNSSIIKKKLFNFGMEAKKINLKEYGIVKNWFWDLLVFNKLKEKLGGRVKTIVTGSAPISPEILDFLRVGFQCRVFEAYGQVILIIKED